MIQNIFSKIKPLIPVLVLACICIVTIMSQHVERDGVLYEYTLTYKHYAAFACLLICLLAFFGYRPVYKYVLLATLILGLFNVISFSYTESSVFFGINGGQISFQLIPLYIILLTILLYFREIGKIFPGKQDFSAQENTVQTLTRLDTETEKFRENYSKRSTEDLTRILEEKKYTPAALEAARRILEERQQKVSGSE